MGFVDFDRFKPKSDSKVIRLSLGKTNGVICGQKRPSGGHIWFKRSQMEIGDSQAKVTGRRKRADSFFSAEYRVRLV